MVRKVFGRKCFKAKGSARCFRTRTAAQREENRRRANAKRRARRRRNR